MRSHLSRSLCIVVFLCMSLSVSLLFPSDSLSWSMMIVCVAPVPQVIVCGAPVPLVIVCGAPVPQVIVCGAPVPLFIVCSRPPTVICVLPH